jgi:hypothetical protein
MVVNKMPKSNTNKKNILTQEQISSSSSTGRSEIVAMVFLTLLFFMRQGVEMSCGTSTLLLFGAVDVRTFNVTIVTI